MVWTWSTHLTDSELSDHIFQPVAHPSPPPECLRIHRNREGIEDLWHANRSAVFLFDDDGALAHLRNPHVEYSAIVSRVDVPLGKIAEPEIVEHALCGEPIHNIRAFPTEVIDRDEAFAPFLDPSQKLAIIAAAVLESLVTHGSSVARDPTGDHIGTTPRPRWPKHPIRKLSVHLPPTSYLDHEDDQFTSDQLADDPVVSYAVAPEASEIPREALSSGAWVIEVRDRIKSANDSSTNGGSSLPNSFSAPGSNRSTHAFTEHHPAATCLDHPT